MKKLIPLVIACLLLAGCHTLLTGVVTVTSVVDSAMKQWAHLSNTHQTTKDFDDKIIAAHNQYRKAAAVAQASLLTYKTTQNQSDLVTALTVARDAAGPLIDLITSLLSPTQAVQLKTQLMKATTP